MNAPASRITRYAPDKGAFPLDHEKKCKTEMTKYMRCLREQHKGDTRQCEPLAKMYLACRMEKGLMDKEEMGDLGFNAVPGQDTKPSQPQEVKEKKGFIAGMKPKAQE
eukprot:TRINITY_DN14111_c0_g1_i2.p2 TRINITY_DN14111_c0_g1~~TRINITY_DN14111_c0_g1_i2.p2  ORF type:complete len:108 (+),score=26.84 TRINITY_DN14111_c0_g1_i2:268-591(+)